LAAAATLVVAWAFSRVPIPGPGISATTPPVAVDEIAAQRPAGASEVVAKLKANVARPAESVQQAGDRAPSGPRLARSGAVDLIAPDIERALSDIARVSRATGAIIVGVDDERPAAEGTVHRASVTISAPAAAFERTLAALSGVARMRSRRVDAEDVGDRIVDDGARLRNLRRTEADLLKIMDRSGRVSEVLDVERELASTREQIERLTAELANTQRRVAYSQINLSLEEESPVRPVVPTVRAQIAGAWHAALDESVAFSLSSLARLFVLLAFAPYVIALILAALAIRALARARSRASIRT
jgi:hypothetical protein